MRSKMFSRGAAAILLGGIFAISAIACAAPSADQADLVLHNGKVVTVDGAVPDGEAVAVKDGKILAVGSNAEIDTFIGSDTEVIDLEGQLAIPGFIDSHVHFSGIGTAQLELDLMGVANWDEVVEMVAAAVAEVGPGELIGAGVGIRRSGTAPPNPMLTASPFTTP